MHRQSKVSNLKNTYGIYPLKAFLSNRYHFLNVQRTVTWYCKTNQIQSLPINADGIVDIADTFFEYFFASDRYQVKN